METDLANLYVDLLELFFLNYIYYIFYRAEILVNVLIV